LFVSGGSKQAYHNPIKGNMYEQVWGTVVENVLKGGGDKSVLEMGCGSGALAEGLLKGGIQSYTGVDFSPHGIALATKRCAMFNQQHQFFVGDVHLPFYYSQFSYTDFVATEVFEHIESDLKVAALIRPGVCVHLSLPNFTTKSHIRTYKNPDEIAKRFSGIIKFNSFVPKKRVGVDEGSSRLVWVCSGVRE
jgi:2-polyprenyl-3-methyl-5-hydroxy-6-metoxy-1,4-benzoquinol methylase